VRARLDPSLHLDHAHACGDEHRRSLDSQSCVRDSRDVLELWSRPTVRAPSSTAMLSMSARSTAVCYSVAIETEGSWP
jgi:hypothetical protein